MGTHFKPSLKKIMLVAMPLFLLLSQNAFAVLDPAVEGDTYALKLLGKYVFFDKVSEPDRMACVSCHDPAAGGTPGRSVGSGTNLFQVAVTGANPHTIGNIGVPTNIYASEIPAFFKTNYIPVDVDPADGIQDTVEFPPDSGVFKLVFEKDPIDPGCTIGGIGLFVDPDKVERTVRRGIVRFSDLRTQYCGGNFWDGRAEGLEPALLPGATKHLGEEVFYIYDADTESYSYSLTLEDKFNEFFGPTADQALNPMPNPVEQNIPRLDVCLQVQASKYAPLFEEVWGEPIDCSDRVIPDAYDAADLTGPEYAYDISFKRIILAVCAWQSSKDLNSWSSKRDVSLYSELACLTEAEVNTRYPEVEDAWSVVEPYQDATFCAQLTVEKGGDAAARLTWGKFPLVGFTEQENLGHDLFYNTAFPFGAPPDPTLPVTQCSFCHISDTAHRDGTGLFERYSDDAYHNIGTPVNPDLPAAPNPGISGFAASETGGPSGHGQALEEKGGFKTPPIRNAAKILPTEPGDEEFVRNYMHNGYLKSIEDVVHFYNTRDTLESCEDVLGQAVVSAKDALANDCWPEAEWPDTESPSGIPGGPILVGNLGMDAAQEAALVAYIRTLSDLETAVAPLPYKGLDDVRVREADDDAKKGGKKK